MEIPLTLGHTGPSPQALLVPQTMGVFILQGGNRKSLWIHRSNSWGEQESMLAGLRPADVANVGRLQPSRRDHPRSKKCPGSTRGPAIYLNLNTFPRVKGHVTQYRRGQEHREIPTAIR